MRALNKLMKAIAMIPVHLILLAYSWFLSFLTVAPLLVIVCCVISMVSKLPEVMSEAFWFVSLLATVPLTVIYFILIETDKIKDTKNRIDVFRSKLRV